MSMFDPAVWCVMIPAWPSIPKFILLSCPTVTPPLALIFKGTVEGVSLSLLTKFAAGTLSTPTTNASAFSAVP